MAALPTPSNARCAACAHCHIDSTPGGVRDANVRARDQLLGVVASAGHVVARRGGRRGASDVRLVQWETAQELEVCTGYR